MINDVKGAQQTAIQTLSNNQQADKAENQRQQAALKEKGASPIPVREVNLTNTAAKLQQIEAQIANQPVVDTQRVESVKNAIADGSLKIDSTRIAEKMAEFENLLASKSGNK